MPTNIITAGHAPNYGNAWQGVGEGISGLAGLLAGAMQARQADKAAAQANDANLMAKSSFDNTLGSAAPSGLSPAAAPASQAASPLAVTSLTRTPMEMAGANPFATQPLNLQPPAQGISSVLPQRFPGLFPQSNSQYGGL